MMHTVDGRVLHQVAERDRAWRRGTKREFDAAREIVVVQPREELAHIAFDAMPRVADGFHGWIIVWIELRATRLSAAAIEPPPLGAEGVNECTADRLVAPQNGPRELIRCQLRQHREEPCIGPVTVIVDAFEIGDAHCRSSAFERTRS